jgi:hypothetical protein
MQVVNDLRKNDIYFIDLLFGRESVFDTRKVKNIFEKTILQKGKIIYGNLRCRRMDTTCL